MKGIKQFAVGIASLFLFVPPIAHTTGLRNTTLALLFIGAVWLWWRGRRPTLPMPLVFAIIAWVGMATATLTWTIDFGYSQGELRNEVLYPLAAFFSFAVLTQADTNWRYWRRVLTAGAFTIALYAFVNLRQHPDWYDPEAYIGDTNAYSTYAVLIAPVLLSAVIDRATSLPWRWFAAVALFGTLGAGIFTENRIMWLAIFVSFCVLAVMRLKEWFATPHMRALVLSAGVVIIATGWAQIVLTTAGKIPDAPEAVEAALPAQLATDPRLKIWDYAVGRATERPMSGFGYGRGILRKDFRAHFDENLLIWHGHSLLLNTVLGGGIPLVVALGAVFVALGYAFWRGARGGPEIGREVCTVALAVLAGAVTKTLTDDILVRENSLLLWSIAGMALGLAASGRQPGVSRAGCD
ncbi:MAG: O-antigen ligase family protein [Candidatus Competibacteraceae bacterium]